MKWIARILVFVTALVFSAYAASFFTPKYTTSIGVDYIDLGNYGSPRSFDPIPAQPRVAITAESLIGEWTGSWGRDDSYCMIVINKVDGNSFSGTLRTSGSAIKFQGTFEPGTRKFTFVETNVTGLYAETWSLGTNSGIVSADGRMLVGDGHDKWGQYGWAVSNY